MKKYAFFGAFLSLVLVFGFAFLSVNAKDNNGGRKIVVYKSGLNEVEKDELEARVGGIKFKQLDLINARAVWLADKASVEKLKSDPAVLRVDDDVEVFALARKGDQTVSAQAQVLPWGIDRIDAEMVWPTNSADPIRVGIIDTGISKDHPDLKANIKGGVSTVWYTSNYNDDNGHGSHVAGIAAALDNTIGVIGVGPKIDLYAVKVLDRRGSGYLSDVIEGIQWATANSMQVINMSLGTGNDIESMHDAVIAAKNAGVVIVAAAGNSSGSVLYPAAYPEVIAVSATDKNNVIASWSSRGPAVDLAAPGVSIYSTYKGSNYATLSGTSMAAPHVAGAAALVLNTSIVAADDVNGNGKWEPNEVQIKLQNTATDLGVIGFDSLFGHGLVNAYNATQ